MNKLIILIVGIPIVEIFIMIKIGSFIGAFNTILLIVFTAITGIYFAKLQGFNTLKSGMTQIVRNEIPVYEIISGAALAFAALLLIFPGFITDILGFLLIIPITRKMLLGSISSKFSKSTMKKDDFIEGEYEEKDKDDE